MEIKIRDNAHELYKASVACGRPFNDSWYDTLKAIAGKTLVVETEYLFKDQFNTPPVEGVSELGLRVHLGSVEKVIDDEREYTLRCGYCGKTSEVSTVTSERCPHCNEGDYLVPLSKSAEVSYSYKLRAKSERAAGGKCEVNESMPTVALTMSDGSEYFFQDEEASNLIDEYEAIEWLSCSIEEYFLTIAQDW